MVASQQTDSVVSDSAALVCIMCNLAAYLKEQWRFSRKMPTIPRAICRRAELAAETNNPMDNNMLQTVLRENRVFAPPAEFAAKAW